ncbi:MAG: bifunctional glutamate N-acetyltransferase/amino-acid acetyltransferase ArgJ [Acidimicrobiia bacterium]|nr:bifunctional glutamate N-acetyltransferase/amino-acid acetyltransferase ArgJ [Acidimicrobiia bacterium]
MSVAVPKGFKAAGVAAGIKDGDVLDLALVTADPGTVGAAVFTVNSAAAAPVVLSRRHLESTKQVRAVVLNSGTANAATGAEGDQAASATASHAAASLGCNPDQVLVCSTGTIGSPLPLAAVQAGLDKAVTELAVGAEAGERSARAIMTTDTVPKQTSVVSDAGWSVGAMAKGSGMIRPDMATMLAVVTTDAVLDSEAAQQSLIQAVDVSFHELNVDGCASTNDTVILLASGASGVVPSPDDFDKALATACRTLAVAMAQDAEGATKMVVLRVSGAKDAEHARHYGRTVADSALVRSAFYGGDPNWGRIVGALGTVAPPGVVAAVEIAFCGVTVARDGVGVPHDEDALAETMAAGDFSVHLKVGDGPGEAHVLTTDLTPDYVRFNGERS